MWPFSQRPGEGGGMWIADTTEVRPRPRSASPYSTSRGGSHLSHILAPFGQNTSWGPYIWPNIRLYGIKIYGIRSKTAYFGPKHRMYDRIITVCRMAESVWCNYAVTQAPPAMTYCARQQPYMTRSCKYTISPGHRPGVQGRTLRTVHWARLQQLDWLQ